MAIRPIEKWREATPISTDDQGSSSDETMSYVSGANTETREKRCMEEEDDPDYKPTAETRSSHMDT